MHGRLTQIGPNRTCCVFVFVCARAQVSDAEEALGAAIEADLLASYEDNNSANLNIGDAPTSMRQEIENVAQILLAKERRVRRVAAQSSALTALAYSLSQVKSFFPFLFHRGKMSDVASVCWHVSSCRIPSKFSSDPCRREAV